MKVLFLLLADFLFFDKKKCLGIKCVEHYPSDNNKDFLILVFIGITD